MGLDANGTRFLLYCRLLGVDFASTAMIGRQQLNLERADLRANFDRLGFTAAGGTVDAIFNECDGYAEPLLRYLGAARVDSFDNSDYEGATRLHDLNVEISAELKGRYSAVLDSGSLEHVFNFPVALKSCMEMVRVGGHFLGVVPANNFMGHGFYQFSPELFLSAFTGANGYELRQLIAFEDAPGAPWYRISRPALPSKRILSIHKRPVYLLVLARRIEDLPPLREPPQQTDYVAVWQSAAGGPETDPAGAAPSAPGGSARVGALLRVIPAPVRHALKVLLGHYRRRRRFDRRYFHRMRWREELNRLPPAGPDVGGTRPDQGGYRAS